MKIATVKYMEISVIKMMAEFRKLSKKMTKDKIWRKLLHESHHGASAAALKCTSTFLHAEFNDADDGCLTQFPP